MTSSPRGLARLGAARSEREPPRPTAARAPRVLLAGLAAALCVVVLPGAAVAASTVPAPSSSSPFSPGLPQGTATSTSVPTATPASTAATNTAGSSSVSSGGVLAIAIGAAIVLGGISFFIWRDARRRAPVRAAAADGGVDGRARSGSKARPKARRLSPAERRRRKRGRARR